MKLLKKLTVYLLLFVFALTAFCSCNNNQENPDGELDPSVQPINKRTFNGTHVFTAPDTNQDFIKDGTTDYVLVVPKVESSDMATADSEFCYFFMQATGINIPVITDEGLTHNADAKYVSLGETELFKSSGITLDKAQLGKDGVRIITKDNTIYILGGSDQGVIFAVYDFMTIYFNFEIYHKDCIVIDSVSNAKLKNFDVTDIPDVGYRGTGLWTIITGDWLKRNRTPYVYSARLFQVHDIIGAANSPSKAVHNSLNWLPPDQYLNSHPDWYCGAGGEDICYTAHCTEAERAEAAEKGEWTELDLMVEACADKAIDTFKIHNIKNNPLMDIITLTRQDTRAGCTCEACEEENLRYGSYAGSAVKFMNMLRTRIDEKLAELSDENSPSYDPNVNLYKRDDWTLTFFAYFSFEEAPRYHLEELELVDGVSVFMALSESFDYQKSVYASANAHARENVERWMSLGDKPLFWVYSTKFKSYMYPVDTFNFYNGEGYSYLASFNPKFIYNNTQGPQAGTTTAWHNLKNWLEYKLQWDSSLNAEDLINEYLDAMYLDAAPYMKKLFEAMRLQASVVSVQYNSATILGDGTNLDNANFWPYNTVLSWLDICQDAQSAIKKYETTDPALYKSLRQHIDTEWLSPAYMILKLHKDNLPATEKQQLIQKFKSVVGELGITMVSEHNGPMSSFIDSL